MLELNYHHLYYFFSVVKAGSIANASADLLLSPPTISAQIKKFERTVKRQLLEKKGQTLHLTPEGRIFFEYARQIFALGDELQDRIRDNTLQGIPAIQFGMIPGLPHAYADSLVRFIRKIEQKAPITIEKHETEKLLPQLGDRRIDFMLTTEPIRHLNAFHLDNTLVSEFPLVVVADKKFARHLKATTLKKIPFITANRPQTTSHEIKNYLELINASVHYEVNDRDDALRLAAQGLGATVVDEHTLATSPFRGTMRAFHPAKELNLRESLFLTSIPRKLKNPLAEKVIKSFRIN